MSIRAMHRRLDRIVRRRNYVEDYSRLSPEEILHLPDEQLLRIMADGTGKTVAEIEEELKKTYYRVDGRVNSPRGVQIAHRPRTKL